MTRAKWAALAGGIGFGFVLGWARLVDYDVIHAMLRLRELDVFFFMGAAVATAAVGLRLLRALGARTLAGDAVAWTTARPTRDHVLGAAVFGLGWSLSGACPGPVIAQLGRGQLASLFTAAGIFAGVRLAERLRASRGAPASAADPCAPASTREPAGGLPVL